MMAHHHFWLYTASFLAALVVVHAAPITPVPQFNRVLMEDDIDKIVPFNSWGNTFDTLSHLMAFVLVLFAAHPLGLLFPTYLRLPLITGYMVAGILSGPFLANLLNIDVVKMLGPYVNAFALSFISFQAGQEIYLPELRPQIRSIVVLLSTFYTTAMVLCTSVFLLVSGFFFYADLDQSCQLGIALMFASISVLVSPSTVMALKIEMDSVGPFTHLALGTCMTAEFVVLVSFSISRIVASIYCAKLDVSAASITFTMGVVLMNIVLGGLLGLVTILIFQMPGGQPAAKPGSHDDKHSASDLEQPLDTHHLSEDDHGGHHEQGWPELKALYGKGFVWLLMGYLFYLFTNTLSDLTTAQFGLVWQVKFEALLVLMLASCAAGHYTVIRPQMHVILDSVAPYIFLPFFVMTGASLKLDKVISVLPIMSVYLVTRYAAIFCALYGGGQFLLKLPPQHYKHLWLTMAPQAGVSLGLAAEVKELITDDWGGEFAATIVAAVVINQMIGPVLCSIGLRGAGESLAARQAAAAGGGGGDSEDADVSQLKAFAKTEASFQPGESCLWNTSRLTSSRPFGASVVGKDAKSLPSFRRVQSAVVLGDDEIAFEIALGLSLYGANVNVPLLDEADADRWRRMNETILKRNAKGDLISFKDKTIDLKGKPVADSNMQNADLLVFTGSPERTLEHAKVMQNMLSGHARPRLVAVVDDCAISVQLRKLGVLTVKPSIALGNIVTRLGLLDEPLAVNLSKELSSTSNFSTAALFKGEAYGDRDTIAVLSEMRRPAHHFALTHSVVNHHTVDYDRLAEALAAEHLPLPPPPSRVSMFGTSAVKHDPFAATRRGSQYRNTRDQYLRDSHHTYDGYDTYYLSEEPYVMPLPHSGEGNVAQLSRMSSSQSGSSIRFGGGNSQLTVRRNQPSDL